MVIGPGLLTFAGQHHPFAVAVPGVGPGLERPFDALPLPLRYPLGPQQGGPQSRQPGGQAMAQHVLGQHVERRGVTVQVRRPETDQLLDIGPEVGLGHVERRKLQLVVDRVVLPEHPRPEIGKRHAAEGRLAMTRRIADPRPLAMQTRAHWRCMKAVSTAWEQSSTYILSWLPLVPPVVVS